MKFLYAVNAPAAQAIDDLYAQVQIELSHGADLYLGLVPFFNGIGQSVGGEGGLYEYQIIAEKDIETFNEKLGDYVAQGWMPHMGVTVWQGYFIQWMCRERAVYAEVEAMERRLTVKNISDILPTNGLRRNLAEGAPILRMVRKAERVFLFSSVWDLRA